METRKDTEQLVFGQPSDLPLNMLPTELDVAKCFMFEKRQWIIQNQSKKDPENEIIANLVVKKVHNLYERASIPVIREDYIIQRVLSVYDKRLTIQKIPASRRYKNPIKPDPNELTEFFIKKKEVILKNLSGLFEVARNENVPKIELEFLVDQRSRRMMTIDSKIDRDTSRKIQQKEKLKKEKKTRIIKEQTRSSTVVTTAKPTSSQLLDADDCADDNEEINPQTNNDPNFEPQPFLSPSTSYVTIPINKRGRDLTDIAEAKIRNEISDRGAAAIVNATLRTFNIHEVIDKSKIRRATCSKFEEVLDAPTVFGGGLGFDGRKDVTLCQKVVDGKFYQSRKKEEHYSLVSLPDGKYIGHVTPADGKARTIATCVTNFLLEKSLTEELKAVACDGTNTNVGPEGGIIHFLETDIGRPLQWFICLLHANELPLRHLITELDGPTSGTNTFSGPIGKILPSALDGVIVHYKRFSRSHVLPTMPDLVWKDLSTDQKYLWRIVTALISGEFSRDLELLTIGPCCHSRWLTTACRICRVYASTEEPSKTLVTLTTYIVDIYAPMWFLVKHHENAVDGPENFFFLVKSSERMEDKDAKNIVQHCIQRNAFFSHPENIILSQLASGIKSDRIDAVRTIMDVRAKTQPTSHRLFRVPSLDFKAKKWQHMIHWKDTDVYEPPLVSMLSTDQLLSIVAEPLQVPTFKCHTQMVERAVKEVTKASLKVVSEERRDAIIKTSMESRFKYPKQETKKDFIPKVEKND